MKEEESIKQVRDMDPPATVNDTGDIFRLKSNQCRFPLWKDGDVAKKYCGKIVCDKGNKRYCTECYSLCYMEGTARTIKPPTERNIINSFHRNLKLRREREQEYRFNWD